MIGNVIDKYEILQKIGEGGMATVYRARHLTLGREVALKILHPHLSSTSRNRQRFEQEARAIERLEHENILKIIDFSGQDKRDCYIITEFIEGISLQELLKERQMFLNPKQHRLPSEIVALIGLRLISALEYAHRIGIIHRDLKPANVMMRRDGTIKLMDFGIAKILDEGNLTVTGTLIGSPAYMSPQQALEQPIDLRSDFFSLGTLLYHLTCGKLPFNGSNSSIILKNIIENNHSPANVFAQDISTELSDLFEALLQTDPNSRPSTHEEVQLRLQKSLTEAGLSADNEHWALRVWLSDPEGYEQRLQQQIVSSLLEKGRAHMEQGEHLEAHNMFNRLLSIDEDNEQVPLLIDQMYQNDEPLNSTKRQPQYWLAFPISLLLMGLTYIFFSSPQNTAKATISSTNTQIAKPPKPETDPYLALGVSEIEPVQESPSEISSESEKRPKAKSINKLPENVSTNKKLPVKLMRPRTDLIKKSVITLPNAQPILLPDGELTITVLNSWADVWINGEKLGRTGALKPINLKPGSHEIRLENEYALPYKKNFTISSGEKTTLEVSLQYKPATVVIPDQIQPDCIGTLDGKIVGTLQKNKYKILISDPSKTHALVIKCPKDEIMTHKIPSLTPGTSFPLPPN